ncbi:MAG TPA: flagellar biosynthetic protein FliO [Nocardioidaceae bacterium]|nr:flagellar biosynthetic protein FliO [Nocardioidaceae bacterium]
MLGLVVRVVASLCIVLGLLWLTARFGSRRLGGGSRALMRVRGRQPLSRTASVAVVEVGSRLLVVGVGDGGVRLLTELDPEDLTVPEAYTDTDPEPESSAPLGGSLLAPQTWKQAWTAATSRAAKSATAPGRGVSLRAPQMPGAKSVTGASRGTMRVEPGESARP